MRLRLPELQEEDQVAKKIREQGLEDGWEDIDGLLHHQGIPYVPEIMRTKLISRDHNNLLVGHFGVHKTWEFVARKSYCSTLHRDVETYVKGCGVCLASKAVCHKLYRDLQSLPVLKNRWRNLSIDFVTGPPISTNGKGKRYDSILVTIDQLTKIVHYESVKVTIDAQCLAEVIINIVVCHHGLLDSIVTDQGSVFKSKF